MVRLNAIASHCRARFDDLVAGRATQLADPVELVAAHSPEAVPDLLGAVEEAARAGLVAAGYVAYEAAPAFDRALVVRPPVEGLPLAQFCIFRRACPVEPVRPLGPACPVEPVRPLGPACPVEPVRPLGPEHDGVVGAGWTAEWTAGEHDRAVSAIKARIESGWTYQVNLTTRLRRAFTGDCHALYRQLATAQAGRYNTYLETPEWAVCCGSPELFFEITGGAVTARPMKGTARRGRHPKEDASLADGLASSPKERAENVMVVDLLRNDIGRVASLGSVSVPELCALERYPTVWQLTSTVRADLVAGAGLAEVFAALFPCGSVTGAPKAATMATIASLEPSPRGVYCGAVGRVEPAPDGSTAATFAVAIRTAVVDRRSGAATYGVGGGITYDSEAAAEWAEIEAKARVLSFAPRRPSLFETFRREADGSIVNLERHLARLEASARHFGLAFEAGAARKLVLDAAGGSSDVSRMRLDLSPNGRMSIRLAPLDLDARDPLVLALDTEPHAIDDELVFHKTTLRHCYEAAARRHPDADDVILVNGRGEVTETTRANLAVHLEGRWWTPDLDCGLLPGVERARLIEAGVLTERRISIRDLDRAAGLATLSSLRGWRTALLADRATVARQARRTPPLPLMPGRSPRPQERRGEPRPRAARRR